jgi:hypothetical protein
MKPGAPERHLLIFWRYPADRLEETLGKIRQRFEINHAAYLRWTRERVVENFQRFYAMVSGQAFQKYTESGAAPFLLLVVTDHNPIHQLRVAGGSGFKKVNINSFDLKQALRRQGGTSLHATNNEREFRRDLMYLMGQPAHAFNPPQWDGNIGSIKELHQDIVAADGWKDLGQVFAVLNEAIDYVVLRNFSKLPDEHVHGQHGDIDLLVEDVDALNRGMSILNKEQTAHTTVGGRKVYVDFRSVENFYYDPEWCRRILRDKVMVRGFYAPNPEDHFFSLLYHGHVQKPKISKDYIPKLMELSREIGLDYITPEMLRDPDKAATILDDWLKGNGYYLTRPNGCPQFNPQFVAKVPNAPFLYQSASNFYKEIVAAQGAKGNGFDLLEQIRQYEANFMSRRFLLRALVHRMASYPRDFMRYRVLRS